MKKISLLCMFLLIGIPSVWAADVRVAVASNFTAPMEAIADAFMQGSGYSVQVSAGSSGKLFAQIINGAPYDVFLSADDKKGALLIERGDAVKGTQTIYALGTLVLWSKKYEQPELMLRQHKYTRLAIADPKLAPYGQAAMDVLAHLNITLSAAEMVTGENITQTWQFVASGNVDAGFVALSQLIHRPDDGGYFWNIPPELYTPIRQEAVLLGRAADNSAAKALLAFLSSEQATRIIRDFGYQLDSQSTP
ncbi:molybdate ABC transporter substrate-binding protein [Thalassolituus oleivorans]|uniref:molybdate ABC transporter substrate-binding protein n=1 Tax=Thalassolituus oleivorans TaxID=187493 RepID=UPI0023F10DD1|nr:molybdate ABC transporter substrate-binding protein [Thalassolituus oleivorans]